MTHNSIAHRRLIVLALGLVTCVLPAAEPNNIPPPSSSPTLGPALTAIRVYPPDVNLTNARDRQSVIVQSVFADGITQDVTDLAAFSLADPSLARLDSNLLYPTANGTTELKVEFAGHKATLPVVVKDCATTPPISFKLDVMPIFMRAGCNTGSCHGAARGKDGFMLSLFGYDPDGDHFRITRQVPGRRINLALPEESLLIQKSV
ncbi:MAG: cell surface protein, partial [Pirellulaceae bacterium]